MAETRRLGRDQAGAAPSSAAPLRWPQWWLALALWLLPNTLFWWAAHHFGYQRPLVNLDYGLALLCWALGWRWVGWALALLALALDLLAGASQVYLLFDPAQMVQILTFVWQARPEFLLVFAAVVLFILGVSAGSSWLLLRKKVRLMALLAALAPLAVLNIGPLLAEMEQQQADLQLDRRTVVLGSQADYLHRIYFRSTIGHHLAENDKERQRKFKPWPEPTAAQRAWPLNGAPLPRRMMLVMVESWGVTVNADELARQVAVLDRAPGVRLLHHGMVSFSGGTVAGELRELCALQASSIHVGEVRAWPGQPCWPQRLRGMGYVTTALHGASSAMYRRNEWYGSVGFEAAYFMQNYPGQARRCYSFPGWCDVDLAPFAADMLARGERSFVYWMTLNSHLPYDARDLRGKVSADCQALGWAADSASCLHHSLLQEFFSALTEAINRPELAGAEVVLVGDHMPPFFQEKDRARFMPGVVPYAHFRVRGAPPRGASARANKPEPGVDVLPSPVKP